MTGLFPNSNAGGLVTRDSDGVPVTQPTVENSYEAPSTFRTTCGYTFLPSTCDARIEPRQINALVSELLCLGVFLNPEGSWDCTSTCNLSSLFAEWLVSDRFYDSITTSLCTTETSTLPEHARVFYCGEGGFGSADFYDSVAEVLNTAFCDMEGSHSEIIPNTAIPVCTPGFGRTWLTLSLLKGHVGVDTDNTLTGSGTAEDPLGVNLELVVSTDVQVIAGEGLEGGGALTDDVTLSLSEETIDLLILAGNSVQTVNNIAPDTLGNVNVSLEEKRLQDSVISAMSESFESSVQFIETAGLTATGDGQGGLYKRVSSPDRLIHHFQSTDGSYWQWVDDGSTSEDILFRRRIAVELPWYNEDLKYFETLYNHSTLYPQSFQLDTVDKRAYILYAPVTAGVNNFPVISVYDISGPSNTLLSTFVLNGGRWKECLVIKHVGAQRHLVTAHDTAVMYNISALPANRSVISPTTTYNLPVNSFLAMEGGKFLAQYNDLDGLPIVHRSQFVWADESFEQVSSLRLPPDVVGTLDSAYLPHIPKAQGIAVHNGRIFVGTGGDAVPAYNMLLPRYQQGLVEVDANGNFVRRALIRPNEFRAKMGASLSWVPDMVENEGLCVSEDKMFSIWCCTHPNNRDTTGRTRGIVITEELSTSPDALNFSDIEYVWDKPIDPNAFARNTWMRASFVPENPILGTQFSSFASVLDFMKAMAIPRMQLSFITGGIVTTLKDINNVDVPAFGYWEFTLYSSSALIKKTAATDQITWNISGVGLGTYAQFLVYGSLSSGEVKYGTTVANPAADGVPGLAYGVTGYVSVCNDTITPCFVGRPADGNLLGFFKGTAIRGSISVSSTGVSYNQTSDALLKTHKSELTYETAKRILKLITIHEFSWKECGTEDVGVFAQELYEIYPRAVFKGGWFLEGNESDEVDPGCEGATYRPWSVDYSKLIPVMLRVIQELLP